MGIRITIPALRKQFNVSQRDLADLLKVSPRSISDKERGITEFTWKELLKISNAYGVTIDDLVHPKK